MTEDARRAGAASSPRGRRPAAAGVPAFLAGSDRGRLGGADRTRPHWRAGSAATRASGGAGGIRHLRDDPGGGRARRLAHDDRRVRPAAPAGRRVGARRARRTGGWTSTSGPRSGRTVLRFVQLFPAGADVTDMALGWHWYLDKLDAEISGRPRRRTGTPSSPRSGRATGPPDPGGRARPSPRPARSGRHDRRLDRVPAAGRRWRAARSAPSDSRDHQHAEHARAPAGRRRPDRPPGCAIAHSLGGEHRCRGAVRRAGPQRVTADVVGRPVMHPPVQHVWRMSQFRPRRRATRRPARPAAS